MGRINIKSKRPLAIVMGRLYTTRLTLVRAAGMVGCDVILIQTHKIKNYYLKIDGSSKYVVEQHYCPEPNENALIKLILSYGNKDRKVVLLPADDWVASVVDSHYDILSKFFLVPNVQHKQGGIIKIMDKDLQKSIANKIGANVAKGWISCEINGVYQIPKDIVYPCFTKPQESYTHPLKYIQKRCDNEQQLKDILNVASNNYHKPILIEEYIEIDKEYGVQGASFEGQAIAPAFIEKDLSRCGITASGIISSISKKKTIQEIVHSFLKEIGMTGIFDMEFYESHGKLYFNEFNVRLGANGFALTYGVANIPGLYIQYRLGENDGTYMGPFVFNEMTFASEKVLRDLYYPEHTISYKEYKSTVKNADILCIKNNEDVKPYQVFIKHDFLLPLKYLWRKISKNISSII